MKVTRTWTGGFRLLASEAELRLLRLGLWAGAQKTIEAFDEDDQQTPEAQAELRVIAGAMQQLGAVLEPYAPLNPHLHLSRGQAS